MAQDEHRMVFDIRGKRRHVVKVVYAILAVLMGLSLFLVTGGLNLGSIFGTANSISSATKGLEEQQERIELKVRRDPQNPDYLLALSKAQLNTGNSLLGGTAETGVEFTPEAVSEYQQASATWSEYLKATDEPNPVAASSIASTFFSLANRPESSITEITANLKAAEQAQQITADAQPSLNSLSILAIYKAFTFDFAGSKKAEEEAKKLTNDKFERESLENELKEQTKRAKEFQKAFQQAAKAEKAGAGAGKEKLQNPLGGLGTSSLGE